MDSVAPSGPGGIEGPLGGQGEGDLPQGRRGAEGLWCGSGVGGVLVLGAMRLMRGG